MPSYQIMKDLVEAHHQLDEPMVGAVWIRTDDPGAWLIEIMPELPDDPSALEPIVFTPNTDFRFSLHLIAGNLQALTRLLPQKPELAKEIAEGTVLLPSPETLELIRAAEQATQ